MPAMIDTKIITTASLNGRLRDLARTGFEMGLSLEDLEYAWRCELLVVALVESKLNCEDAAHLLGVHRNTITRMMREAGIRINRQHHVLEEVCFDF
jgi:transcriptional regulator of acetoin/glycerol metabolism